MSGRLAPGAGAASPRLLFRQAQQSVRTVALLKQANGSKQGFGNKRLQPQRPVACRPVQPLPVLPRLLAGCSAAAVSLFVPLLPSWASEVFDDGYIDPALAESPDVLGTLLIVVSTYLIVMMMYLWLSSFLDEDATSSSSSSNSSTEGKQQPPDQSELPPGYGSFLNAHVRSYVDPAGSGGDRHVRALAALDEVTTPLEGETLQQLKERLAAGAAEAMDQQIRDVERLVRTKLLARKLGYTQGSAKLHTAPNSTSSDSTSTSSSTSSSEHFVTPSDFSRLLTSAVLTNPDGINSCQHKAALDAFIDKELQKQLPPGGGAWHDDLIVRGVMRRVVRALVMEESLLLLEGVDQGRKALEAAGRLHHHSNKNWALW